MGRNGVARHAVIGKETVMGPLEGDNGQLSLCMESQWGLESSSWQENAILTRDLLFKFLTLSNLCASFIPVNFPSVP